VRVLARPALIPALSRKREREGTALRESQIQNEKERYRAAMTSAARRAILAALSHTSQGIAMRTWIRRTLLTAFGASIALGALTACGHSHHHHGWANASAEDRAKMREKVLERVARRLELNDEQKKKLAVLADRLQEQRAAFVAQGDPRAQVKAFVAGDKFDRAKAQAFVAQKAAAVQEASPQVIAALGDFYDSLNPAQQAKVREAMQGRRRWWHS
jgi:protein CpxP